MSYFARSVLLVSLVALGSGCPGSVNPYGGVGSRGVVQIRGTVQPRPTGTVTPPPTGTGTGTGTGTVPGAGVRFINATGLPVCFLFVSPVDAASWGADILGTQTLPPDTMITLALDAGVAAWNVLAADCQYQTLTDQRAQPVPPDRTFTIRMTGPIATAPYGLLQVHLVNTSSRPICALYVSLAGQPWGESYLPPDQSIPTGEEVILELDGSLPLWDYRADDCSGAAIVDRRGQPIPFDGVWKIVDEAPGA